MQPRRYFWLNVMLLALACSACTGGSGSSGFDALPSGENSAIDQALSEQQCVQFEGLNLCPADQTLITLPPTVTARPSATPTIPPVFETRTAAIVTPTTTPPPVGAHTPTDEATSTPTPTATPTPAPGVTIDTGIDAATPVGCRQSIQDATCSFTVPFAPRGFPPTAVFRVAVRHDSTGPWTIGSEPESRGTPASPSFDAVVLVDPVAETGQVLPIQLGVLVFEKEPPDIPIQVEVLAQSGADFAFITPEFEIVPLALP